MHNYDWAGNGNPDIFPGRPTPGTEEKSFLRTLYFQTSTSWVVRAVGTLTQVSFISHLHLCAVHHHQLGAASIFNVPGKAEGHFLSSGFCALHTPCLGMVDSLVSVVVSAWLSWLLELLVSTINTCRTCESVDITEPMFLQSCQIHEKNNLSKPPGKLGMWVNPILVLTNLLQPACAHRNKSCGAPQSQPLWTHGCVSSTNDAPFGTLKLWEVWSTGVTV